MSGYTSLNRENERMWKGIRTVFCCPKRLRPQQPFEMNAIQTIVGREFPKHCIKAYVTCMALKRAFFGESLRKRT